MSYAVERSKTVDTMSGSDALLWSISADPVMRPTIVALIVLDGKPNWAEVRARVTELTAAVPRLRSRAVSRPLGRGRPQFVVDENFALDMHLRHIRLPENGTLRDVFDMAQTMATSGFDAALPLWEAVLVEVSDTDRSVLVMKVHHALIDGVGGLAVLARLFDPVSQGSHASVEARPASGAPEPRRHHSALGRVPGLACAVLSVGDAFNMVTHPVRSVGQAAAVGGSVGRLMAPARRPMSPIMTGRSFRRHVETLDLDLTTLKHAAKAWRGTLNDVFVTSVMRGLTLYHAQHGVAAQGFRVLMPVSVRDTADREAGNHFVPARFVIPVHSDIADSVAEVRRSAEQWKHAARSRDERNPGRRFECIALRAVSQPLEFDAHGRRSLHHEHPGAAIADLPGWGRRRRHLCRHSAIGGRTQRVTCLHGRTGLCHHHNGHSGGSRQSEARRLHGGRILRGLLGPPTRPPTVDMTASIDLLTELDASFLYMESPYTPMHMGSIGIFEGGPLRDARGRLRLDAVRAHVEGRLQLVAKLRKVVRLPLVGESAPVWVDDPDFDISYHVREAAVPEPGGEAELLELCARLMSSPLDRDRPLWGIWLIDGLGDGRVAVLEMIHHCLADGLAGVELASVLLDLDAGSRSDAPQPDGWAPAPAPPRVTVVADGLAQFGGVMSTLAADVWHAAWHPTQAHRLLSRYASAFRDLLSPTPFAPRLSLNTAVGFDRQVLVVRERMADLRRAQERFGVTLNDLLLTAVAAGVHDLLSARGDVMEGRQLQVLVPVGSDHHDDHRLGNEVSAMLVRLPISAAPPAERLRQVAAVERSHKEHGQARATNVLFSSLNSLPPAAVSAASHLMHHQPFVNLVVTNVPGPDIPLYLLGGRLLEVIPLVPLGGNLSVSVAALSYNGLFTIGVLADPDSCPDADVLTAGIERCFAELLGPDGASPQIRPPSMNV